MLNYHSLTQQQYVDLLVNTISSFEGPAATVYQKPDDRTTIGYGYTFFRNNNLALWQAAGITLTPAEVTLLQSIDAAPDAQKDSLALQFTRSISTTEAVDLLRQTYPQYEGPANTLLMPFSNERAAFVSLTYNRGIPSVNTNMQAFFTAIANQDRAEAWYQMRYNSNGRRYDADPTVAANGITNRRIAESNLFSLYNDSGQGVGETEAKNVVRMYTTHRTDIQAYESQFATQFAPSGTATIQFQLTSAITTLIADFAEGRSIDGEVLVGADDLIPGDTLPGTALNDLIFGENGHDILKGEAGDDVLLGGEGTDQLTGGTGNDYLDGGAGYDTYIYRINDGQDTISDSDGKASIFYDGKLVVGGQRLAGSTGVYTSLDGTFTFLQSGTDLIINNLLTIKNYTSGQNGITLRELSTISTNAPVTTRTIVGDFQPLDTDLVEAGVQIGYDDLGNVLQDPLSPGDRSDILNGSGGNDTMNGGALADRLTALGGSDMLTGGSQNDVLIGQDGNDQLFADQLVTVSSLVSFENFGGTVGTGVQGDFLTGGINDLDAEERIARHMTCCSL